MTNDPASFIAHCEADASLVEADALRRRFEVLDSLDGIFATEELSARALLLRARLEQANLSIYNSIRADIQNGHSASRLLHWIKMCSDPTTPLKPGLGYDALDELVSGVLSAREPGVASGFTSPDSVFYQPTPARHILQLIQFTALSPSGTLIDLGSGLGHVPILASILTGARTIGIESQLAYVQSARACATALRLDRVSFIHQNAAEADLAPGTVFYLYTPFTGNTLKIVLENIRRQCARRHITICTLGPCATTLAAENWLTSRAPIDPNQITTFQSR